MNLKESDAHFIATELGEKWPALQRRFINTVAQASQAPRLVELSRPVAEAGIFDSPAGTALVLANFTCVPIPQSEIRLPMKEDPLRIRSLEKGPLKFTTERAPRNLATQGYKRAIRCTVPLDLNDIVLVE